MDDLPPEVLRIMAIVKQSVLQAIAEGKVVDLQCDVGPAVARGLADQWPEMGESPYRVGFAYPAYGKEDANLHFTVEYHYGSGVTVYTPYFEIPWAGWRPEFR